MPNLKQDTLPFASAKRTNSFPNGKKTQVTEKGKNKRVEAPAEVQSDIMLGDVLEVSSEEDVASGEVAIPSKRIRTTTKTRSSSGAAQKALLQPSEFEKQEPSAVVIQRERLDVDDKAGRYHKYYNEVRSKTGYLQPVHSEGQNKIHQILRFFDMSYEFGPCIGMTRLERWERAEALGLDPPIQVRDILLTKEGVEKDEYAQCVLHGEV